MTNSRGAAIYFNPEDSRGQSLSAGHGEPYPNSLALWQLALGLRGDWDAVLDIGANYGEMLAGVSLPVDARLLAFEPNPQVLPYLRKTLDGLGPEVELVESALGDKPFSRTPLEIDLTWSGRTHLASVPASLSETNHDTVDVNQTTLDEFFAIPPRALCMKIDVEGYEMHVLRGAKGLLQSSEFVAIMLEILHMPVQEVLDLSRRHPLYLLDIVGRRLVRYTGRDGYELGRALHAGDLYRQDALLLGGLSVDGFDAEVRNGCDDTLARETRTQSAQRAQADELRTLRRRLQEEERNRRRIASLSTALDSFSNNLRAEDAHDGPA